MAFRFALAPVLRLRQSVERQRTLQLQEANLNVTRARENLAQLDSHLSESAQADFAALSAGRTGAEVQFASFLHENLIRFREELQANVNRLERLRQQAVTAYQR